MPTQQNQAPPSIGYGRIAKRITAWTTNALLSAIVLVAGIAFGRQVLVWWAEETPPGGAALAPSAVADGLGDPAKMHVLQFGDLQWTVRRQSIGGDREAAAESLRASCRELLCGGQLPDAPPSKAEIDFIASLAALQPLEQLSGTWQLYEQRGEFPMVVGTREGAASAEPTPQDLAAPGRRVVAWGLAVPAGPRAWTLFTFQPGGRSEEVLAGLPEVPLPPQCRKTVSMRVIDGSGMIAFDGPAPASSWTQFYDRWFEQHDWRRVVGWHRNEATWYGRYASSDDAAASVDVHFGPNAQGRTTGLLVVTPPASHGE